MKEKLLYKGKAKEVLDEMLEKHGDSVSTIEEWTGDMTIVTTDSGRKAHIRENVRDNTTVTLFKRHGEWSGNALNRSGPGDEWNTETLECEWWPQL